MNVNFTKSLQPALIDALQESDTPMPARVARACLAVWKKTRQNGAYEIPDADAAQIAYDAQAAIWQAKGKVPPAFGSTARTDATFSNAVQRIKKAVRFAPTVDEAIAETEAMIEAGQLRQSGLALHNVMEAIGTGSLDSFKAKRAAAVVKAAEKAAAAGAIEGTPQQFAKQLDKWLANLGKAGMACDAVAFESLKASIAVPAALEPAKPAPAPAPAPAPVTESDVAALLARMTAQPQLLAAFGQLAKVVG